MKVTNLLGSGNFSVLEGSLKIGVTLKDPLTP
jgi:hypothetical protein